ncbi:hypothetical protein MCEMSE15_02838 [Fimbriimonadaceae bacterium]
MAMVTVDWEREVGSLMRTAQKPLRAFGPTKKRAIKLNGFHLEQIQEANRELPKNPIFAIESSVSDLKRLVLEPALWSIYGENPAVDFYLSPFLKRVRFVLEEGSWIVYTSDNLRIGPLDPVHGIEHYGQILINSR